MPGQGARNAAAELVLRAERRVGAPLKTMPKNKGGRPSETQDETSEVSAPSFQGLGIPSKEATRCQQIASRPEEDFEAHIETTKGSGQELTTGGVLKIVKDRKEAETEQERQAGQAIPAEGRRVTLHLGRFQEAPPSRRTPWRRPTARASGRVRYP